MKHLISIPVLVGQEQKPAKLGVEFERDGEFRFLFRMIPAQTFTMTREHADRLVSVLKKMFIRHQGSGRIG